MRVLSGPWGSLGVVPGWVLSGGSPESLIPQCRPPTLTPQTGLPCRLHLPALPACWLPGAGSGQWEVLARDGRVGGRRLGCPVPAPFLPMTVRAPRGPCSSTGSGVGTATLNGWSVDAHPPLFVLFTLASPLGSIFSKASFFKQPRRPESYWVSVGPPPTLLPARGFQKSARPLAFASSYQRRH